MKNKVNMKSYKYIGNLEYIFTVLTLFFIFIDWINIRPTGRYNISLQTKLYGNAKNPAVQQPIIADHKCIKISSIPAQWIKTAKSNMHIMYWHTSHGSQITSGMSGLYTWKGELYAVNGTGSGGALELREAWNDAGSDSNWSTTTSKYLDANLQINVVVWSWCGQVSSASESTINTYLNNMRTLEQKYPNVKFVYMTGHLDGGGVKGNLHKRNEQIRAFCKANNKILYDFEDIESYNPDGVYFGDKIPTDNCDYDKNGDGMRKGNWAIEWQNSRTQGKDWYNCESAHSQPLNANMKAYAAWWLWARLAGWDGKAQ
jgi:hypothetical protein